MRRILLFIILSVLLLNSQCKRSGKGSIYFDDKNIKKITIEGPFKVVGVKDGDTFSVLIDGREQVVRFAHIDCPEKKQDFGKRAKQFVAKKSFGKYIFLRDNGKHDRYGRLIAEVILEDNTNLNQALVRNGLAWHFKRYSKDKTYDSLEKLARKEKIGLWVDPNPIPPWEYRRLKRHHKQILNLSPSFKNPK